MSLIGLFTGSLEPKILAHISKELRGSATLIRITSLNAQLQTPPRLNTKNTIMFKDIDVSTAGLVTVAVVRDEATEILEIQLPYSFLPATDLLATAFASLCGRNYTEIHIDLPIPNACRDMIETLTQSRVVSRSAQPELRRDGKNYALNFSGGFDSLAALSIMPKTDLISLDFGGRFSREEKLFRQFSPYKLTTNLIDLGLNRNHWSFMFIGSILLRDELNLGTYASGGIMAATAPRLERQIISQAGTELPQGRYLGMSLLKPVAGLSEIGALTVTVRNYRELVSEVLESVALPGEDKYLRKLLMLSAVLKAEGLPYSIPDASSLNSKLEWGRQYATDFSSLYLAKILGPDIVSSSYSGEIPSAVLEFADTASLEFFRRINPHAYGGLKSGDLKQIYSNMALAGLEPYQRRDWEELRMAISLLSL